MQYTTERLRLRPLGMEDTDAVWELVSDEAIGGQLYCGVQRTREEAARLVQGYLDDPDRLPFAVLEGESGTFAGVLVLRRYGPAACEQTLYLGRPFWNKGYARELLTRSFSMAADLLGAREIVNYVSLDNTPSVRVQESLGFVLSGTEEYPGCPAGVGIFRRALTAAEVIHPGRWRHFKGGEYQVLGLGPAQRNRRGICGLSGALRRAGILGASGLHVAGNGHPGRTDPAPVRLDQRGVNRLRPGVFCGILTLLIL